jgi:hypothetical protein
MARDRLGCRGLEIALEKAIHLLESRQHYFFAGMFGAYMSL